MPKVVNLDDYRNTPHMAGICKCMSCGNEGPGVAPVGTISGLECSVCGRFTVVVKYDCGPETTFVCNCGCDLFRISPNNTICYSCGSFVNP